MDLGINAGFGDPVSGEFPLLVSLGFKVVRQDLFAKQDQHRVEDLIAEFANQPIAPIFLLAGDRIQHTGTTRRIEPDELAERAQRIVRAATSVGLMSYAIETGNEPDIAVTDYAQRPEDFAEAVRQSHDAARDLGFVGRLISGAIANLNDRGLSYLRRMLDTGSVAEDVTIGFHRYPETGKGPEAAHDSFRTRDDEWAAFQRLIGSRQTACTEFGYHTALDKFGPAHLLQHRRTDQEVTAGIMFDIDFFAARGVGIAVIYQLNDGIDDTALSRYGIRHVGGTLKPVAEAIRQRFGPTSTTT